LNDCPFRYQGQYEDSETGLYYNRYSTSPQIAVFFTPKAPGGLAGGNPTLYEYVHNPKGLVDVFGLSEYNATEVLG